MNNTTTAETDRARAERLLSALVASRRECVGLRADLAAAMRGSRFNAPMHGRSMECALTVGRDNPGSAAAAGRWLASPAGCSPALPKKRQGHHGPAAAPAKPPLTNAWASGPGRPKPTGAPLGRCLKRADSAPTAVASGRAAVRAIADIPLRAGAYMCEAGARAAGDRAAKNKHHP